ncbi:MAG: hypothetical protein ABI910_21110 [Gemmatimonadota bacterium]
MTDFTFARPIRRHFGDTPLPEATCAVLEAASHTLKDIERDREFVQHTLEELSRELESRLEQSRISENR